MPGYVRMTPAGLGGRGMAPTEFPLLVPVGAMRLRRRFPHHELSSPRQVYLLPTASCQPSAPRTCLGIGTGCGI